MVCLTSPLSSSPCRPRPVLFRVVAFAERDAQLALEAEDLVWGPVA